jgi:hypothetical protein
MDCFHAESGLLPCGKPRNEVGYKIGKRDRFSSLRLPGPLSKADKKEKEILNSLKKNPKRTI